MGKVRVDVVQKLSLEALSAMDGCGVDHLTVAEVASAAFTLTQNVIVAILEQSTPDERAQNEDQITQAIANLYALVKPERVN